MNYAAPAISRLLALALIAISASPTTTNPTQQGVTAPATPPVPAAWSGEGCPMAFNSGTNYGPGDVVSVPKTGYTLLYQCTTSPNYASCSMSGFEPNTGLYADQAWTVFGTCTGIISPTGSREFVTLADTGGCPAEFSRGENYEEGDRISKDGLVYQCKLGPSSRHCSQDGFEPGTSFGSGMQRVEHWKEAWSILGYCSGTITPTTAPAFVSLPDMGGCPENWSPQSYGEGDRVSSMNLVLECNSWPLSLHCGQIGYEPHTDLATPGAWKIAWTVLGFCEGTIEPTGAPNFDPTNNVGPCPEEWVAGSTTKYEEGDIVSVITSTNPIRKAAFKCREWPLSRFCGQFSPANFGGNLGWIFVGSCDGTFAPTGAPAPYDGVCQYSKCEMEEMTITNCRPGSSGCSCTSIESAGAGCTKQVEEKQCTDTAVEPWNIRTQYVADDVIRLGTARFKCREWPFYLWCRQFDYLPTLASDGIWNYAWVADGSCGPTTTTMITFSYRLTFGGFVVPTERAVLVESLERTISTYVEVSLEDSTGTLQEVNILTIEGQPIHRHRLLRRLSDIDVESEVVVFDVCTKPCPSEEEIVNDISNRAVPTMEDEDLVETAFRSSGNDALASVNVVSAKVTKTVVGTPPSSSPTSSPAKSPSKAPSPSPTSTPSSGPSSSPLVCTAGVVSVHLG